MYVKRKYIVQKSFRLDEQVDRDISILAKLTERSQNELVNCAISEFLQDNKEYFLDVAIAEHFDWQIENEISPIKDFEMGGLTVRMKYTEDDKVEVYSFNTKDGEIIDENTSFFENDTCEEFEEWLRKLSIYIDRNSDDAKRYIELRTDYSDYVKISK